MVDAPAFTLLTSDDTNSSPEDGETMDSLASNVTGLFTWPAMLVQLSVMVFSLFVWWRYLSPLADVPGPFAASFSRWWHIRHIYIGDQNLQLVALHDKHGISGPRTETVFLGLD
jgi:hypothetical protein